LAWSATLSGRAKDQLTICRALPQTFAHTPNAHFVFVGGRSSIAPELQDDCVSYCRAQVIDGRVHFLGQRADVPDVLSALDILFFRRPKTRSASPSWKRWRWDCR
jgi:glycosyltransferase involved in cell wall biosynthesis